MKNTERFRKILVRGGLFALVLLVGGWWFENWRGAKAWEAARARAKEAGMSLERADYAGPAIPADENLRLHPLFEEELGRKDEGRLREWGELPGLTGNGIPNEIEPGSGTTLDYRSYFEGELTEEEARTKLADVAEEFEGRLEDLAKVILAKPVHLIFARKEATVGPNEVWARELNSLASLGSSFADSALMAMRSGEAGKALQRIRVLDRLSRSVAGPSFLSFLISSGVFSRELELIWEGLRLRLWTEEELAALSALLAERDFSEPMIRALGYEATFVVQAIDRVARDGARAAETSVTGGGQVFRGPAGWQDLRKAWIVETNLDLRNIVREQDYPGLAKMAEGLPTSQWSPVFLVSQIWFTESALIGDVCWGRETAKRIALLALAAERHFRNRGDDPATLEELAPSFPVIDLTDPQGRELAYRLGPRGRPQIWSRHQQEQDQEKLRWQFSAEKQADGTSAESQAPPTSG